MLTIGIDPGLSGAIAFLDAAGTAEAVHDLPVIRDARLSWIDGQRLQSILIEAVQGMPARVVIERVHSMPAQGIASAFNFGCGFGSILAIVQARHLPLELVTPTQWKRQLGIIGDKRASLDRARLLFPSAELHLAKHDGRAEALLVAYWHQARRASP